MVGLGDLSGGMFLSGAQATSANGSVIVGFGQLPLRTDAFLWTAKDGMRSLQDMLTSELGLDLADTISRLEHCNTSRL